MTVNYLVTAPGVFHQSIKAEADKTNPNVSYPIGNGKQEGFIVEEEVYKLLLLLDAEGVFMPPSKIKKGKKYLSFWDTTLKVDILIKVGKLYLGWQVKSSLALVDKHLQNKEVTLNGKSYPTPGLIVIDHKQQGAKVNWKYKLLVAIAEQAGVPLKPEVVNAIKNWQPLRTLKDKQIPLGILKPEEVHILSILGLVVVKPKYLQSV